MKLSTKSNAAPNHENKTHLPATTAITLSLATLTLLCVQVAHHERGLSRYESAEKARAHIEKEKQQANKIASPLERTNQTGFLNNWRFAHLSNTRLADANPAREEQPNRRSLTLSYSPSRVLNVSQTESQSNPVSGQANENQAVVTLTDNPDLNEKRVTEAVKSLTGYAPGKWLKNNLSHKLQNTNPEPFGYHYHPTADGKRTRVHTLTSTDSTHTKQQKPKGEFLRL